MYITLDQSSPENIVSAPVGAMFMRKNNSFFLTLNGKTTKLDLPKKTFALPYKSKAWYPSLIEDGISFKYDGETWVKKNGSGKTGWSFLTSKSAVVKQVTPTSLLVNPSFEDGLNGWTVSYKTGSQEDTVLVYSGSNYFMFPPLAGTFTPPSGEYAMIMDSGDPTTSVIYQDFYVPPVVNHASISFYYAITNETDHWVIGPNLDYDGPDNQHARIDIMNTSVDPLGVDGILVNLYKTQETDPLFSDYQLVTIDITSYLQSVTGQVMRFRAAHVNNMDALAFGLDNVIISVS